MNKLSDLTSESALLCCMMTDGNVVDEVLNTNTIDDFTNDTHKLIFQTITDLYNENKSIDAIVVASKLKANNHPETEDTIRRLSEISDVVMSAHNWKSYSQVISEFRKRRELLKVSEDIRHNVSSKSIQELMSEIDDAILSNATEEERATTVSKEVMSVVQEIEKITVEGDNGKKIDLGFKNFNQNIGKVARGMSVILAGRPAMGKTSLVVNMIVNASIEHNYKIVFFSLEMTKSELIMKMLSQISNVNYHNIRNGILSRENMTEIIRASSILKNTNIYIDDSGDLNPRSMRSKLRKAKARLGGIDLVITDYLQLMSSTVQGTENDKMGEISRRIKILAKEFDVASITLSQLSRKVEEREKKKPLMSDLRSSGSIEQDADMVLFIYRDEYYNKNSNKQGIADIIIAKNRHGATGEFDIGFNAQTTTFYDI